MLTRRGEQVGARVAPGAALLWLANLALRILQLATTAVLARVLTPADYGVVALATTITGLLEVASDPQFNAAIIRTRELDRSHVNTAFTIGVLRGVAVAACLVLLAEPAAIYLGNRELIGILYVLSFVPILKGMSNPYFILYERDLSFKRESLRLVLSSLGGSLVGIVLAVLFRTYWALVGGVVVSTALSTVLSYWRVSGIPRFSLAKTAELLSFGGWLLLIRVIDYLNGRLDYLLIGRSFGSGKLGSYHIGQQTILIATGDVIGPISRAIFPAFSMISSDPERLRWSYRKTQSVLLALTLPIGFCVSVLAQDIVLFLVGRKWMDAVPVIELLAPIIALHALLAGVEGVALTTGQTRALLWRTTLFFVVRASLLVVGFNLGGFLGIVYARVASGLFFLVYGLGLAARITGSRFSEPLLDGWRSFASVGIMAAALATLPPASPAAALPHVGLLLGAKIAMGGALYAATHILLWLASGRPTGAETRLIEQTAHMIRALRASVGRTPQE